MNPLKFKQAMDYLTRIKKVKPDLPEVFPANQAVVPPKKESLETMEAINEFVLRNPRQDMAQGGRIEFSGAGLAKQKTAAEKYGMSLKKYQGLSETEKQTLKSKFSRELKRKQGIQTDGITVSQNIKKMPSGKFKFETQAGGKFSKTFPLGTKLEEVEKFRDETLLKRKTRVPNPDRGPYKSVKGQKHIKFNGVTYQVNIQRGNQGSFYTSDLDKAIKKRDELVKKFPAKTMTEYNIKEKPKKINAEILELSKNPTIKNIFKTGVLTNEAITEAANILKVNKATAIDRLEDLATAFSGDRTGVPGIKPTNIDNARKIASSLPGAKTKAAELATGVPFTGESIKVPKGQIYRDAPYDTSLFDIDEARATATGLKRNTSPYSIFGQIIKQDINRNVKGGFAGSGWDSRAGTLERNLDEAIQKFGVNSKQAEAAKIQYNKEATLFENKINKNKRPGAKKIEIPKISLDAPNKTIANYKNLDKTYQNVFNENFKTKKYSFKIPKNLNPIPKIVEDFKNPKVRAKVERAAALGDSRLYSRIPVIQEMMDVARSIPGDLAKKSYFKAAGKAAGLAIAPVVLYDTYKALEQGKPLLESLEQGIIGTNLIGGTKDILSLNPEERMARSVVKQDALKDLNLDMPMGFGFIEGPTPQTNMTLPEAQQKMDAGIQRVQQERAQRESDVAANRANFFGNLKNRILDIGGIGQDYQLELAGGGIAKLAGVDSGPPPASGPNSQGLQGLMKRVKRI